MDTQLLSRLWPGRWLRPSVQGAARSLSWFAREKLPSDGETIRAATATNLRDALELRGLQMSNVSSTIGQLFTSTAEISDVQNQLQQLREQTQLLLAGGWLVAATPLPFRESAQKKAQVTALFLHAGLNDILQADKGGYFITAGRRRHLEP